MKPRTPPGPAILISTLTLWASAAAAAPFPEARIPYGFRLFSEASYFSTKANFDDAGESADLPNNRYYKNYGASFGAERWLSANSSLLVQLGTAYAESFASGVTRRNSSLTEAWLGYRKVHNRDGYLLVSEWSLAYPFNRVDKDTDNVLTGEGAMAAEAGLWASVPLGWATPYSRLGLRYRDEGRASHGLWQLGSQFRTGSTSFYIGGKGSVVVADDENADNPTERHATDARVSGGSLKYYAVNPSDFSAHAGMFLDLRNVWRLSLGFEQTLSGKNTADGATVTLGLQWIMRTKSDKPRVKRRRPRLKPLTTDPGVAPTLNPTTTLAPPPAKPVPAAKPAPTAKPAPAAKPATKPAPVPKPAPKPEPVTEPAAIPAPPPGPDPATLIKETPKAMPKIHKTEPSTHPSKLPAVKQPPKAAPKPAPAPEEDTSLQDIQNILGN